MRKVVSNVQKRRDVLERFAERLGLVGELYDAHEHWKQTQEDQDYKATEESLERVVAHASADLEYKAQEAERRHAWFQGKAETKAAAAEQATGLMNKEKRRLAHRALAARRRRARGAGVELPEDEDNPQETPRVYPEWHHLAGQEIP